MTPVCSPRFRFSQFATRFSRPSGLQGMLNAACNADIMLGLGDPASIPQVNAFFREQMVRLGNHEHGEQAEYQDSLLYYSSPQGHTAFREAVAELLNTDYGLDITAENIALTSGSQTAFFMLFNAFSGPDTGGKHKKILFPLSPEYIGYEGAGLYPDSFTSMLPAMEIYEEEAEFKYIVNTAELSVDQSIGAICVSRPTNPTGNVISDAEVGTLRKLAAEAGIPLILDTAYGYPFPQIQFSAGDLVWEEGIILCMSLSKLGLAGGRAGIVVAHPDIIGYISATNAKMSLAPPSFLPGLLTRCIADRSLLRLCHEVIAPFYRERTMLVTDMLKTLLADYGCLIHKNEGSFFVWVWLRDLPISSTELYERLAAQGVIIVSGEYFFPGVGQQVPHMRECIRISCAADIETLQSGVQRIAAEIKRVYSCNAIHHSK